MPDPTRDLTPRGHPTADPAGPPPGSGPPDPAATRPAGGPAAEPGNAVLADRYVLGAELGRGGMGTVYRAEQVRPVRRAVAVKLVNPGMDSARVLARFEAERQALAVMDHPHIAKVLDAGTTPEGRPFFVMEFVDGVPLTDYCDARRLSVADRLDLFRLVCGAVQHAHQKGVIHRDLKPSNILVAAADGRAVPKVIDFGIAKAVGETPLTDRSAVSITGAVLGTPLYMAPEQAGGAPDVDTRADVYALGVVLYELLTGSTPIDRETLKKAAVHELLRVIREDDPPAPSSRLSTSDALPAVAANRGTEPAWLGRLVRGDLDWVVMKALDKDRARRYDSAAAFAADVDRFLRHEPVSAGPPSRWYRARKFARRNRAAVTAAGLVLAALLAGIGGATAGLVEARRQRDAADAARQAEGAERERAEAATGRAYRALDTLTEDALEGLLARQAAWGDRERAFLGKVRDQFEQLAAAEGESDRARHTRAAARLRLGSVRALLGDAAEAEADYRAAAAAFDRLADPPARANAAQARRRLGGLFSAAGRYPEARDEVVAAAAALDRLAAEAPADPAYRFQAAVARADAGYAHFQAGDLAAAEADDRAAAARLGELAAAAPGDPGYAAERARALHNLYTVLRRTDRPADAAAAIDEAVALLRAAAAGRPDPRVRAALGKALQSRAAVPGGAGDWARAEPFLREAAAVLSALAADYPAVPDYRLEVVRARLNLGVLYGRLGRPDPALAAHRDAAATALRLADDFPGVPEYRLLLARARLALGEELTAGGRPADGEAVYADAVPVWEKLWADDPKTPVHLAGLVNTLARLGAAADLRDDHAKAREVLERADRLRAAAPDQLPRDPLGVEAAWRLATFLPRALVNLGDHAAAAPRADALAANADIGPADNAFNAACYLARCAGLAAKDPAVPEGRRAALADDYAGRAVGHLRTAAARGFKPVKQFATDTDLAPLRGRKDYQEFLAGLR